MYLGDRAKGGEQGAKRFRWLRNVSQVAQRRRVTSITTLAESV